MGKKSIEDKLLKEMENKDLLRQYDMEHPVWKSIIIDGNITKYEISNIGTVRDSNGVNLTIYCRENFYPCVYLQGFQNMMTVHRLVAQAFIPNPENKAYVNHIDGNKRNNWVGNLEWTTPKENSDHAWRTGLVNNKGELQGSSIYTNAQVEKLCQLMSQGILDYTKLEKLTGIKASAISDIRLRRQWKSISDKYKFNDKPFGPKYTDNEIITACQMMEDPRIPLTAIAKYTNVDVYTLKDIIKGHSYMRIANEYNFPKRLHYGQYSGIAKYTNEDIVNICKMLSTGTYSTREISNATGVHINTVCDVLSKRRWNFISDKYDFSAMDKRKTWRNNPRNKTKTSTTIDQLSTSRNTGTMSQ